MSERRKVVTADCVRVYHFEASTSPSLCAAPREFEHLQVKHLK